MSDSISLQKVIEYVEVLSTEEQDLLVELIQKRRIENRREEIAINARKTLAAFKAGNVKCGNIEQLKADLLDDDE